MLPLIPLVLSLAPELATWLFGDKAEKATAAVVQAVQTVTGTADPLAAKAVLARDPATADILRVELAKIAAQADQDARSADLASVRAQLADVADARQQTQGLARAGSHVAWGAPVVSLLVLVTFGIVMAVALTRSMPPGSETTVTLLLGTLATMASSVVAYWVGSSAGSERKTDLLFRSMPVLDGFGTLGAPSRPTSAGS